MRPRARRAARRTRSTAELARSCAEKLGALEAELDRVELASLLSGEYDDHDAVASLHAGAGGIDSQDWAEMLLRMYLRWAEREGLQVELDEVLPGEEAGIKSATFTVKGTNAYGLLSAERGVHRLVRLSPFDQAHRRHTSFASPRRDPAARGGRGGRRDRPQGPSDRHLPVVRRRRPARQHHRLGGADHPPARPGITAACQNERSQLQNRAVAMRILKARLAERMRRERSEKLENLRGERRDIEFGSQIRSYVLHPYRMVKDHRTDVEVGNVDARPGRRHRPLHRGRPPPAAGPRGLATADELRSRARGLEWRSLRRWLAARPRVSLANGANPAPCGVRASR